MMTGKCFESEEWARAMVASKIRNGKPGFEARAIAAGLGFVRL